MHHGGRDRVFQSAWLIGSLPDAGGQAAEQEGAVALDEGREEGEHAVYGERDEESLPSADSISQAPPDESPHHHPQVHDQTWRREGLITMVLGKMNHLITWLNKWRDWYKQ